MRALALAVVVVAAGTAGGAHADYIDHFANPNDIGTLKVPRFGETNVVVIPVIIEDLPFEQGSEAAFLEELNAFYDPDAQGWAFTPYWVTASLGRFTPRATVANAVRFPSCPPIGEFDDCAIPRGAGLAEGNLQGAGEVLVDAMTFLDQILSCATGGSSASCESEGGLDLRQFDNHGTERDVPDGVADGILIVSNAGFPGIALPVKDLATQPLLQLLGGPFPEFEYDGVVAAAIAISGFQGPPQHATWVSVHEFGHLLGWADLYNEAGTTTDMPYTLMGGWFYQDPASLPDSYSRIAAGYGHVVQVTGNGTFEIGPVDATGTVLKVGSGDEFFLVELRREVPDVLDGDMRVPFGVVVERVRMSQAPSPDRGDYFDTLTECVNCIELDAFLSIEQADGDFDLERNIPRNDNEDLFLAGAEIAPSDDTEPRTIDHLVFSTNRIDGAPTGIRIRVVEASEESATIEIEAPTLDADDACSEIERFCYDEPCVDGANGAKQCGEVVPAPPPPPVEPECACASTSTSSSTASSAALGVASVALLGVLLRRRRRR